MTPSPPEPDPETTSSDALTAEDRQQRIVVLTARRAEYENVLTDNFTQKLVQNHPYWARDSDRFQVRLTHVGTGEQQAKNTLGKLQSIMEGDLLIVAGTAGALHEDLREGDVYVPTALASTDAVEWQHPDQKLLHWLVGWLRDSSLVSHETKDSSTEANLRLGPMVTSPRPVIDAEQREELRNLTGAMAVDMESAHVLDRFDHSQDEDNQWVGLRVISDDVSTNTEDDAENQQTSACQTLNQLLSGLIRTLD